jgi:hypothetical protein
LVVNVPSKGCSNPAKIDERDAENGAVEKISGLSTIEE